MSQQHNGTVCYYAGNEPHAEYGTFSIGVTPDDSHLVPEGKKCLYISERDTGEKTYLRRLRKDDRIVFFEAGQGRNGPYYNLLETNAQGGFAIEDPVVEELLGTPAGRGGYQPIDPHAGVPSPPRGGSGETTPRLPLPPTDELEQFGAWADLEARKLTTLYRNVLDNLDGIGLSSEDTRTIGAMASTLYIAWSRK